VDVALGVPHIVPKKAAHQRGTAHSIQYVAVNKPVLEALAIDNGSGAVVKDIETARDGTAIAPGRLTVPIAMGVPRALLLGVVKVTAERGDGRVALL
jgi:hypothetical protein